MQKTGWEGRYYEDFEVGDVYRHPLGRTITEADNIWFTAITHNTNQIHFNADYAAKTPFGRPLVNSTFTLALVTGLGVSDLSQNGFALGWDKVRLPNPLYVGDTVYAQTRVIAKRESRSNPDWGLVTVLTQGFKQDGTVVIEFERTMMVWKRDRAPQRNLVPEPRTGTQ